MPKPKRTSGHNYNKTTEQQGCGYYIPDSMSNSQWQKIKQKWDQQLKQSGFDDIEMFSHALTGHFYPTFATSSIKSLLIKTKGAASDGIVGYYDYCSSFYELADFKTIFNSKRYKRKWALQRELFRLHKDGVSYGDVLQSLKGVQTAYMKRFNIPASHRKFRQSLVKSTVFVHTSNILSECWYWHATDPRGSLTPYDLEHMECTGITAEVIARAKAFAERATAATNIPSIIAAITPCN